MCRSISEEIRQSFRVFHETFHRGYQELEGNVLKKVEELESRIETLEMMAEGRSNPNAQMKPKPKGAESCVRWRPKFFYITLNFLNLSSNNLIVFRLLLASCMATYVLVM